MKEGSRVGAAALMVMLLGASAAGAADVFVIDEGRLYKVGADGAKAELGATWNDINVGACHKGAFYAVQRDTLYKALPDGKYESQGTGWAGTTALCGGPDGLYAAQGDKLVRFDPEKKARVELPGAHPGVQHLAFVGMDLCMLRADKLFHVDVSSGEEKQVAAAFNEVTAAGGSLLQLYVVQRDTLYEVNAEDGTYKSLGTGWKGATELACLGADKLVLAQGGKLWLVDLVDGSKKELLAVKACTVVAATEDD